MDNVIKKYREQFFLTNPRFDKFEKIIFTLHIVFTFIITAEILDNPDSLINKLVLSFAYSYLAPKGLFRVATLFFKKK